MTDLPPDPANPDLLTNLRAYLATAGLVRVPSDGTHPTLPPLWLSPRNGVPGPGQTEGLAPVEIGTSAVLGASKSTGIVPRPYEGFLRRDGVEFTLRSDKASTAYSLENSIRAAINDRRGWYMGAVFVDECLLYRDLTPIGADNSGYLFMFEYMFSLWGPYPPTGP